MLLSLTAATGHAPAMPNHKVPSRMRIRVLVTLAAAAPLSPSPALAWGRTGHRVIAAIAYKQMALRFVVRLVGDLHQPRHVGRPGDEGGGQISVTFFGKPTNLHVVWDSGMPDNEQLSFTEFAAKLERHTSNQQLIDWWDINPRDWVSESAQVREEIYADLPQAKKPAGKIKKGEKPLPDVGYVYVYKFQPVMERQLQKAGVRLAAYLNSIFAEPQPLPAK